VVGCARDGRVEALDAGGLSGLWHAHAERRLGVVALRDIDARRVVAFRGELLAAGVAVHSVVKTLSMLQRVFRDAVEYGDVAFNPFKAVTKPAKGPSRDAQPLMPLQVERLTADIAARGYGMSALLVRLMAYTGLRPQEALALHWYAVRKRTLLVKLANADGELDGLKNWKRSWKRSGVIDLLSPLMDDLATWRREQGSRPTETCSSPMRFSGGLWLEEHYKTWRRRIYVPSAENVGLPSRGFAVLGRGAPNDGGPRLQGLPGWARRVSNLETGEISASGRSGPSRYTFALRR
jgi:integrase